MTDDKTDWRLRGQERYLQGRSWSRRKYARPRPDWDHDHCCFCNATFIEVAASDVLDEGYATDDGYYWVCSPCFEDFKEMFGWSLGVG